MDNYRNPIWTFVYNWYILNVSHLNSGYIIKWTIMKVLCFGDSITQGRPGVTYLKYLDGGYKNYGIGGDTLLSLSSRIKPYIESARYERFIIEVGANDILLPFLMSYSPVWSRVVERTISRGKTPCRDLRHFTEAYESLLLSLGKNKKSACVVSIPCIGEDTRSVLNKQADSYNLVIKELCSELGFEYTDFNSWQKRVINSRKNDDIYFISRNPFDVIFDSLLTTYLHLDTRLSKKRDLAVTVDGVHLNSVGAKGLAEMIKNAKVSAYGS